MMSVFEYAEDMNKTVSEILKKCKELGIDAYEEEDMLDDEAIIMLDNEIENNDFTEEEEEDNYEEETSNVKPEIKKSNKKNFIYPVIFFHSMTPLI